MQKKGSKPAKPKPKAKLPEKLVKFLDAAGVKHEVLEHRTVYTAFDVAQTLRRKIGEIAKSLLIKADKDYFLIVLPADHNADLDRLTKEIKKLTKKEVKSVKIPGEKIMAELLKLKQGGLGAFGKIHDLPVIVDKNLAKAKKIVFPTGNFNHSVELAVKDWLKMEEATVAGFGVKKKIKLPKIVKKAVKKIVKKATKKPVKKAAKKKK